LTSAETVYESTPRKPIFEINEDEGEVEYDNGEEEDVRDFGRKKFGEIASPYLTPYLYMRFLDNNMVFEGKKMAGL
jgi:hypothetical protein